MNLETIVNRPFTQEDLDEIKKTKSVKFKPFRNRISINLYVVYEKKGDSPSVIEYRRAFPVNNSLDMYKRTLDIEKGQTLELEFQWLDSKAGAVYIANITGQDLPTRPTEAMKQQIEESEAIVHIGNAEIPMLPGKMPLIIPAPRVGRMSVSAPKHNISIHLSVLPE